MRKFYAKLGVECEIEKCENERCMDHLSFYFLQEINTRPGAYLGGPRAYVPSIGENNFLHYYTMWKKIVKL